MRCLCGSRGGEIATLGGRTIPSASNALFAVSLFMEAARKTRQTSAGAIIKISLFLLVTRYGSDSRTSCNGCSEHSSSGCPVQKLFEP
ncbi:MAG: hypothetical protein JWR21_4082 [Herminiimonas sp.]|nr:hypothetical protein [Herminiimonas sp.]